MLNPRLIGPLIRFFAHLVLVMRSLGQLVPDTAANIILQTYLGVLEQEGDHGLIAMYAACLREGNGEESYARILRCKWYQACPKSMITDAQPWIPAVRKSQRWRHYKKLSSTISMWPPSLPRLYT
jgi:hypothetical protein